MKESDRARKEPKWEAIDDTKFEHSKRPVDYKNFKGVAMEPQRIRTFLISFNNKKTKLQFR